MPAFDPEKFEAKYVHYFPELERAYKRAFEHMNDRYDSQLVHAIDQQVLNESEPMYTEDVDRPFRVELPENPYNRVQGVLADEDQFEAVLAAYVDRLEYELERVFGFG